MLYDIRLSIYKHLDINDLVSIFQIDQLSYKISLDDYFWITYFSFHQLKIPSIKNNWIKSYKISVKTQYLLNDYFNRNPLTVNVMYIELNHLVLDMFDNVTHNKQLYQFMNYKYESFFYDLRIIKLPNVNTFNFFCGVYEQSYDGYKRNYDTLDLTLKDDLVLYHCIYTLLYHVDCNPRFYSY